MDALDLAGRLPTALARRLRDWKRASPLAQRLLNPFLTGARRGPVTVRRGIGAGLVLDLAGTPMATALGLNESDVLQAFADHVHPGQTLFDVGANVGLFTLIGARLVGADGQVCAFEPAPATAAVLRRNVERNGITTVRVLELAASRKSGRATLQLHAESPRARLSTSGPLQEASASVEVALVALDALVADGTVPPPHFIKMDIEGAEVDALEGLRDTLRTHRPSLIVEVHGTQHAVVALLRDVGYDVRSIECGGPAEDAPDFTHVLAVPGAASAAPPSA